MDIGRMIRTLQVLTICLQLITIALLLSRVLSRRREKGEQAAG